MLSPWAIIAIIFAAAVAVVTWWMFRSSDAPEQKQSNVQNPSWGPADGPHFSLGFNTREAPDLGSGTS